MKRIEFFVGAAEPGDWGATCRTTRRECAMNYLAEYYGGVTVLPHTGSWIDPGTGETVTEAGLTFICLEINAASCASIAKVKAQHLLLIFEGEMVITVSIVDAMHFEVTRE